MENKVENLLIVYSADDGLLKILLQKNDGEPYKGYWMIPGEELDSKTTQEESALNLFKDITSVQVSGIMQGGVFSDLDRKPEGRTIAITSVIVTDKDLVELKKREDVCFFDVEKLPKIAYDHEKIIDIVTKEIKDKIIGNYSDILLKFFPSDFTLPEFQKFYESVLGKNIDRRNFRKKIMTQHLVIDTGEKTTNGTGRPGTLYRFDVENMKGKKI